MTKSLNVTLMVFMVAFSYFVFKGFEYQQVKPFGTGAVEQPSMIPGAEAVRPLAAGQSDRIQNVLSELTAPVPVEPETGDLFPASSDVIPATAGIDAE